MSDVTRPQQDPKPGRTAITSLVITDLAARRSQGIAKYGGELRSSNGRDALVDAYQEALDLVMYLRQEIEEREEKCRLVSAQLQQDIDFSAKYDREIEDMMPVQTAREFIDSVKSNPITGETMKDMGIVGAHAVTIVWDDPILKGKLDPVWRPHDAESIAQEAHRLVLGDRGAAYGHPIFDMTRSADMVTSLFRDKLRVGVRLEAEDIGQAMVCIKQSRHRNAAKRDNLTDTAGYALTLQMIAEWREANPGVDPRDRF